MSADSPLDALPRWGLAAGPLVVLALTLVALAVTSPFGSLVPTDDAGTLEDVVVDAWLLAG